MNSYNISYQADVDLNQAIVTGVRRQERWINFQTANAAELKGVKDSEVLAIAAQQERILVSHDLKTMPSEFAKFIRSNYSPGLIIVPQKLPVEVAIKELLMIWLRITFGVVIHQVTQVEKSMFKVIVVKMELMLKDIGAINSSLID
ncbi:DUF5615 family PIN-like protein [Nostoc cf. edaphicum LEGE 07299]|uniref:DUF5615 family PIN-like protein n=1 Tax=Nostoc cf. edaphicum LEGE 07299 TaxID=2777974 RepID=A0ABR9U044_9NOSO|nr:DUF5615 family PIN-like protein [Nostoc edaphicum]MBE9106030.1 DUF5615 family PIN-like protein [Nostoc cf. edaphicum LEGE 07299]